MPQKVLRRFNCHALIFTARQVLVLDSALWCCAAAPHNFGVGPLLDGVAPLHLGAEPLLNSVAPLHLANW